jgi:glucose/arabinose dehydrogenase
VITNAAAQDEGPTMVDPRLDVRTAASGLELPTAMAFIGSNDMLVLEKNTGKVQRVVNGAIQGTVLGLDVNFGSERGLLRIALHPASRAIAVSTCIGARARSTRTRTCCPKRRCSATASTGSCGTARR